MNIVTPDLFYGYELATPAMRISPNPILEGLEVIKRHFDRVFIRDEHYMDLLDIEVILKRHVKRNEAFPLFEVGKEHIFQKAYSVLKIYERTFIDSDLIIEPADRRIAYNLVSTMYIMINNVHGIESYKRN